jgi:secernin
MCDTLVAVTADGLLFAKNSDRDANEAQVLEWHAGADHAAGASVRATWIEIPQVAHTNAVVISRPWWMWGAEMGANEHGVVIGNEAVFTKEPTKGEPGLLGMDLLRLALERATTAEEAVHTIVDLLERHGQVGSCSHEHPSFTYHNSFLVADQRGAIVVETAGRHWASEMVTGRARSISNGLTIPGFAERYRDPLRGRVAQCAVRRQLTQRLATAAVDPLDMMEILRDNGTGGGPRWSWVNGSMRGPNMHAGGLVTASQTVSSWVADLRGEPLHWVTATADPALSLFKPVRVDQPADVGPEPSNRFEEATTWWRHELLHRLALRDWARALEVIRDSRDELQVEWAREPADTEEAFKRAGVLEAEWLTALRAANHPDIRPRWLRRVWDGYEQAAAA